MDKNDKFMCLYSETVFILDSKISLPESFAIITAHNPQGVISNIIINNINDADFKKVLLNSSQVKSYQPILGCSPDLSHKEDSYAIETSKKFAFNLSKQFKQNAFFWVEQGQLSIVPVLLQRVTELDIGAFNKRLR